MSIQHPQEEDALSFEWPDPDDPRNISFILVVNDLKCERLLPSNMSTCPEC